MKSPMCCARLKGRLVHEQGNLARLAQNVARRQSKGLVITDAMKLEVSEAKAAVAMAKTIIEDHEADHAGVPEAVAS